METLELSPDLFRTENCTISDDKVIHLSLVNRQDDDRETACGIHENPAVPFRSTVEPVTCKTCLQARMSTVKIELQGCRCQRCGYEWIPNDIKKLPKVCPNPKCKSPYWSKPRRVVKQ